MKINEVQSLKRFTKDECLTVAWYFYNIAGFIIDYKDKHDAQTLYNELVQQLGLKDHAAHIMKAVIRSKIKNRMLIPCNPLNYTATGHPFAYGKKIEDHYEEDEQVFDNCGLFSTNNPFDIDFCRLLFNPNSCMDLRQLIYLTFFTKPDMDARNINVYRKRVFSTEYKNIINNPGVMQFLKEPLELSDKEISLLKCIYYTHAVKELDDLCCQVMECTRSRNDIYYGCTGMNYSTVNGLLKKTSKIVRYGFCNESGNIDDDFIPMVKNQSLSCYFTDIVRESRKKTFDLASFSVTQEETALVQRFLSNDCACNILLYGTPGSGKTEYALSCAAAAGLKAYVYRNEMEVDADSDNASNRALCRLNCLLSVKNEKSVIIVDEAESVLKTCSLGFFGMEVSSVQKGTVNRMIDETPNKVIWIVNYTNQIDESTRRRFTYSVQFPKMPCSMLRSITQSKLKKLRINQSLTAELLKVVDEYNVTGSSVDNMVKTLRGLDLKSGDSSQIVKDIRCVLKSNSSLLSGSNPSSQKTGNQMYYDLGVINSSVPGERIVSMISNADMYRKENPLDKNGIRMLFYGMSGTGKTELARHIAGTLNKKIIIKKPSDILGPLVGDNERNIKAAFEEAEAEDAVLLFDEADSFFADRSNASSSWERTQVNEFLTQMESFDGILICTTNLRSIMDPALARRFHIMAEFKALTRQGIQRLLQAYFADCLFDAKDMDMLAKYDSVTPGDFGTLKDRMRFMDKTDRTPQYIISELASMQEQKAGNAGRIGFGS